jgi:formate dehydrogenase
VFWLYRTIGPHLESPALTATWLLCVKNALMRRKAVLRTLGPKWRWRGPLAIAEELYKRVLAHPEGVEIARSELSRNLQDHVGTADRRIRLSPPEMLQEIERALSTTEEPNDAFPLVLSAGVRTPWTANTIHRDPAWRKGKGPHCSLLLSTEDAHRLGVATGARVVLETARGSAELPARVDKRMQPGHVAVPNGFGTVDNNDVTHGVNLNALTASDDRDPFTGCPHHKHVRCRVTPSASPTA